MDYSEMLEEEFEELCRCLPEVVITNNEVYNRYCHIFNSHTFSFFAIVYIVNSRLHTRFATSKVDKSITGGYMIEVYDTNPYRCIELTLDRLKNLGYE